MFHYKLHKKNVAHRIQQWKIPLHGAILIAWYTTLNYGNVYHICTSQLLLLFPHSYSTTT